MEKAQLAPPMSHGSNVKKLADGKGKAKAKFSVDDANRIRDQLGPSSSQQSVLNNETLKWLGSIGHLFGDFEKHSKTVAALLDSEDRATTLQQEMEEKKKQVKDLEGSLAHSTNILTAENKRIQDEMGAQIEELKLDKLNMEENLRKNEEALASKEEALEVANAELVEVKSNNEFGVQELDVEHIKDDVNDVRVKIHDLVREYFSTLPAESVAKHRVLGSKNSYSRFEKDLNSSVASICCGNSNSSAEARIGSAEHIIAKRLLRIFRPYYLLDIDNDKEMEHIWEELNEKSPRSAAVSWLLVRQMYDIHTSNVNNISKEESELREIFKPLLGARLSEFMEKLEPLLEKAADTWREVQLGPTRIVATMDLSKRLWKRDTRYKLGSCNAASSSEGHVPDKTRLPVFPALYTIGKPTPASAYESCHVFRNGYFVDFSPPSTT